MLELKTGVQVGWFRFSWSRDVISEALRKYLVPPLAHGRFGSVHVYLNLASAHSKSLHLSGGILILSHVLNAGSLNI
jgi:hypothetical protein